MSLLRVTADLARKEFNLDFANPEPDEEQLIAMLSIHISDMLEHRPEQLFSTLYIMDVSEKKVRAVIDPSFPGMPAEGLARLVVERLHQKAVSRQQYQTDEPSEF